MTLKELGNCSDIFETINRLQKDDLIEITQSNSKMIREAVAQSCSITKSQIQFEGQTHLLRCIVRDLVSLEANGRV